VKVTNDTYCVVFEGKRTRELYYRDEDGWLKISSRGNAFRATAEQVLNHLLPALSFGDRLGLTVTVEHYASAYWRTRVARERAPAGARARSRAPRGITTGVGTSGRRPRMPRS
jgi:hypothetical protein